MFYTDLDFSEFSGSHQGRLVLPILQRHGMSAHSLVDAVLYEAHGALPKMTVGTLYTPQEICGPGLWGCFESTAVMCCAALCLRYLVESGEVPLALITPSLDRPLQFRLP